MIDQTNFTLADSLEVLKRRKWAIIIPFVVILIVAAAIALLMPPIYKSTATILIEEQEIPSDYVMSTVTSYADQRLQVIKQRIMSGTRLQELIDRFGLYADLEGKKSQEEIIEVLRKAIQLETIIVDVVDRRSGRPTSATIAFTLSYEGKNDPVVVQRVTNVLASFYLEENIKVREKQVAEASDFFEGELSKVKVSLDGFDDKIVKFKQLHEDALPEFITVHMQNKHNVELKLEQLNEQRRFLKERESVLISDLASTPPIFNYEKSELEKKKIILVDLQSVYTDAYPAVQKLKLSIAELEKKNTISNSSVSRDIVPDNQAFISLSSQLASVQTDLDSIKGQSAKLEENKVEIDKIIAAIPANEKQYLSLDNERRNAQRKYDDLMAKYLEAKVAQGLEQDQKGERFTLIDPPMIAEKPYKPNRLLILAIGIVVGAGVGIGLVVLREFSDDSVRSYDRLQQITNLTVLATIPEIITPYESAKLKRKKIMALSIGVVILVVAAISFQLFVMDYQILWIKLLHRLGG